MDAKTIQKDFPVLKRRRVHYFDTAATSLTPECVVEKQAAYYRYLSANVHRGVYQLSFETTEAYEEARRTIASFVNAAAAEIVFTRGASSSLNLVASALSSSLGEGDEIIVSELEHHSNFLPWLQAAKRRGARLVFVPLDAEGRITVENFQSVLGEKTKIVALTHVSNVMGYRTPIEAITRLAQEAGALVVVDAAQSVPHMKVDVEDIGCDFLAFSAHKALGPTGLGVLYGKLGHLEAMEPVEYGGDMVDQATKDSATWQKPPIKFETGTPPIAEVLAFAEAVRYLEGIGVDAIHEHESKLRAHTMAGLRALPGITIHNETTEGGLITLNIDGIHPHDAVTYLDTEGFCLRAGHHCAQPLMQWLDVPATLRISFYVYNTIEECDGLVEAIAKARDYFHGGSEEDTT